MPWWLDNAKLDFPRGYHIEVWGGRGMPAYGFVRRHPEPPARRRLREGAQAGLPRLLRLHRRLLRPRRDDPQRRHLLRDRSATSWTSTAFPCCASTGSGPTTRYNQVEAHAGDLPRADRGDGRRGLRSDADAARTATACPPADRSSTSSAARAWATTPKRSVLNATARPTTCKNLFVADGGPFVSQADKNPDLDDPRALHADERLHRRTAQAGGAMTNDLTRREAVGTCSPPCPWPAPSNSRRPRSNGRCGPPNAPTPTRRRAPRRSRRSSSPPTNGAPSACWPTMSSRATPSRGAPPTPRCPSSWTSSCGDKPDNQLWMRGGLAWLDPECERRFNTDLRGQPALSAHAGPRRHRVSRQGAAGHAARRGVLQPVPRSHGVRLLYDPKLGIDDLQLHGNTA